jgi:fermentation-respiration switch protein FrsA (DUF1100 family)
VGNRRLARILLGWLTVAVGLLAAPSVAAAEPQPFGHPCKAQDGVRFCPTETLAQRVPSWDGVPLDADVTLPSSGTGPWPTIVMMHGWSSSKTEMESSTAAGGGLGFYEYNNIYFAQHGYAVLNYSSRGFGNSCGSAESRANTPACEEGFTRLADTRYESRDTQYLLGLLADERIVKPRDIGVTGASYGGGQTVELAYLKNRIRLTSGELAPWRSPKGKRMEIKAAYARWPWSDLLDALVPNGRFRDDEVAPRGQSYEPFGVELESVVAGLYAAGDAKGYYAPEGEDEEADLTKWFKVLQAGEPITPEDEEIEHRIYDYHDAYGVPLSGKPAPLLLENGWTDDLFPVTQALRVYNQVRALKGYASLMFGDLGHLVASNKENTDDANEEEGAAFFAAKLEHEGTPPKKGSVAAFTETCPKGAPGGGPYRARSWAALHPGTVAFGSSAAQTITSLGGNAALAAEFDPVAASETPEGVCTTTRSEYEPNSATYTTTSPGFVMLGLPTISAHVAATGEYGQIDARLWDVLAGGEERLVSRGVYRLTDDETGAVTFQLHGNGYEFAKGDTVKLELLGRDAPYYRADNSSFSVEVSNATVTLPTS